VVLGDTQELRDVFSRALVEHAQRDHRALNLAELRHARSEPQSFHRTRHELVGKRAVPVGQLESVDFVMRARSKMSPSVIAGGVTNDRGQNGGRIAHRIELTGSGQIDERAQPLLYAVDSVFGCEPFAPRDRSQRAPLALGGLEQPFELVLVDLAWHEARGVRSRVRPRLQAETRNCAHGRHLFQRGGASMANESVYELSELDFDSMVLRRAGAVLVDFTAAWCGPCKALSPIVARIADATRGRVLVTSVDVDASPNLAAKFGIRGMPTLVVFQDGKEVARRTGLTNEAGIRALLEPALASRNAVA
jgi:thioredoxin 1